MKKLVVAAIVMVIVLSCSNDDLINPINHQPEITNLTANPMSILQNDTSIVTCMASDIDKDTLTYNWDVSRGLILGNGSVVKWIAPDIVGLDTIICIVDDGELTDIDTVLITVTSTPNNPPEIIDIVADSTSVNQNESTNITCIAKDSDGDSLSYYWSATGGSINGNGSVIKWISPNSIGTYTVSCIVSDGKATDTRDIDIKSVYKSRVYLFNGLGDIGTLSVIDSEGGINNDVMSVGKWPNHIIENSGLLYVTNSGNNNVQIIDASTLQSTGSVELTAYSNPMRAAVSERKLFVTNMMGQGIDVYDFDNDTLYTIALDGIPMENGTDAIISNGNLIFAGVKNYSVDYDTWETTYNNEHIAVIDAAADTVVTFFEAGINIADIIIDHENELHVLSSGNRDDIEGFVTVFDTAGNEIKSKIELGSQPSSLAINNEGIVYAGVSGLNPDWSGFGHILKYNSVTNEVLNSSADPVYSSSSSGIMDLCMDGYGKLYAPLFDENELVIFENDEVDTVLATGTGPQGLVFLRGND